MKKKLIILAIMIIIPVIAAMYGFQFGTKQVTVAAVEPKEEIEIPGIDKGFSESEAMIREIVWKNIGFKETVHDFEYTNENNVYLKTEFSGVDKDLKKTLKILKELEEKCGEVINSYLITYNKNGYNKMLELEFNEEVLSGLDFSNIKASDLINLATTSYLDESLKITE